MERWFPTFRRLAAPPTQIERERPFWPIFSTRSQRASLLRLIAVAIEQNVPMLTLLQDWAHDESGVHQRRMRKLVRLLEEGHRLVDALEQVPAILSEKQLLAVRFDSHLGTRAAAIRQVLQDAEADQGQSTTRFRRSLLYFFTVIPLALLSVLFTHFRILPKLERLLEDFSMAPSPYWQWMDALLLPLTSPVGWLFIAGIMLASLLLASQRGRNLRVALTGRLFRWVRDDHAADVINNLALAQESGRPLTGALSTLARYHFDALTRHKLLYVRNEMEQGAEVWKSLATVRLLTTSEASLLQNSPDHKYRGWLLRQLASVKHRRIRRRLEQLTLLIMPAVVLLLALVVVLQAFAIFEPLVRMIQFTA